MNRAQFLTGAFAAAFSTNAFAQSDPFGSLYGGNSPAGPSSGARTGSTGVSTAVGRSYAGAQEKGSMSLAQIAFLPKTVPALPVQMDVSNEKFLARRPRIAIPSYALGFIRGGQVRASSAGAGSEIMPRATKVSATLIGVDDALTGRLTEEAHADLVERLTDAGFDVVPAAETQAAPSLQALPRYQGVRGGNGGTEGRETKVFTAQGASAAPMVKGYAFDMGMGSVGPNMAMGKISKELDAVLLFPQLMLDPLKMDSTGNRRYVGSAFVDVNLRFHINASVSNVTFAYGNDGGGSMPGAMRPKPVGTDEAFGVMYELGDRSDSVAVHNALAQAGFGSLYRQSLVYGVEVVPERWAALSRAAFQGFNQAIVDRIKRARAG